MNLIQNIRWAVKEAALVFILLSLVSLAAGCGGSSKEKEVSEAPPVHPQQPADPNQGSNRPPDAPPETAAAESREYKDDNMTPEAAPVEEITGDEPEDPVPAPSPLSPRAFTCSCYKKVTPWPDHFIGTVDVFLFSFSPIEWETNSNFVEAKYAEDQARLNRLCQDERPGSDYAYIEECSPSIYTPYSRKRPSYR